MAKITRVNQKIFGSTPGFNQMGQIGSLNAGTPVYTTDPDTMQSLPNFLAGLYDVVVGGNSPAMQDANSLYFLTFRQLAYLMQAGIAEWNSATTYYSGNVVNTGLYIFTVTSANATVGATYTNNGATFTVLETISSGTTLLCVGTASPAANGTLTKTSGTGDSTITFSLYFVKAGTFFSITDNNLNNPVSDIANWTPIYNPMLSSGDLVVGANKGIESRLAHPGAAGYLVGATGSSTTGFTQNPTLVGATAGMTTQNDGSTAAESLQAYSATAANGARQYMARSRNASIGSHTIVQSGDRLAMWQALGSNGTSFDAAGFMAFEVDGTPGASADMPGRWVVYLSPDGSATPAELMRLTNGGYLLLGVTSPNTNGGVLQLKSGITFPATQVTSSDVNTLDDYEEGTFTPAFTLGTSGSVTLTTQQGSYTKIGNVVFISILLEWSGSTSPLGTMTVNLPFTSSSSPNNTTMAIRTVAFGTSDADPAAVYLKASSAFINFRRWTGASDLGGAQFAAGAGNMAITGHYFV